MAVYTRITEETARELLATLQPPSTLARLVPLPQGSINTTYRIDRPEGAPLYLRINEGKAPSAVVREVGLVTTLARARLPAATPTLASTADGRAILPLAIDGGRLALVFHALPGEDLAAADVAPVHTAQVGAFLAHAHRVLRGTRGAMPNPYAPAVVRSWLHALAPPNRLEAGLQDVVTRLSAAHAKARARRRPLPRSIVHGDLFIDNTKWQPGAQPPRLAAVFDWEMAGRDACMLDVATAIHAWCFGPRGFALDAAEALVDGYQRVRRLAASERRGLFTEALLAAIRFTTSRIRDFEVRTGGDRAFLDYRDFLARLDALEGLGERAFRRALGIG